MVRAETLEAYLRDLGGLLKESAFEARQARDSAVGVSREFLAGRVLAYNEVISLLQQQCHSFGLELKVVGLEDIDPDRDLV
jgi:hypothetical protein